MDRGSRLPPPPVLAAANHVPHMLPQTGEKAAPYVGQRVRFRCSHVETARGRSKLVVSHLQLAPHVLVEFLLINLVELYVPGVCCLIVKRLCCQG